MTPILTTHALTKNYASGTALTQVSILLQAPSPSSALAATGSGARP